MHHCIRLDGSAHGRLPGHDPLGAAPEAVEAWGTIRDKLALVHAEAELTGPGYAKVTVKVLDAFTSLSKDRDKLAHGFFGIVEDRDNQFAWRQGAAAAKRMAVDLASSSMLASPTHQYLAAQLSTGCRRSRSSSGNHVSARRRGRFATTGRPVD
jgi:hypothetical protein